MLSAEMLQEVAGTLRIDLQGGNIEFLPSGAHTVVIRVTEGNGSRVLKLIHADGFFNDTALFTQSVAAYHQALVALDVPTASTIDMQVLNGRSTTVVLQMPYLGIDLERQVRAGALTTAEAAEAILTSLVPFFENGHHDLPIGVDPKVTNFVSEGDSPAFFIDLTPPRLWQDGAPLMALSIPYSPAALALERWRHFTANGVALVLQNQLSRVAPDERVVLKTTVRRFLRAHGRVDIARFLEELPSERFFTEPTRARRNRLESAQPSDIYFLREVAIEAASRRDLSAVAMEEVFHLTHFSGFLPTEDRLREAKSHLQTLA